MINAHRKKYHDLYWGVAYQASKQSVATRRQVGCCIVTAQGMLAVGWNGMPAGFTNQCELVTLQDIVDGRKSTKTDPRVIHAERNALDKLTREGISPKGALVFVTTAPCIECAKSLYTVGVAEVHYLDEYSDDSGVRFLKEAGVKVVCPKQ